MKIQWYPGHVARARREIKDHLKLVDIVIEVIDARCPNSSINFLSEEIKNKKHLLILNKYDLADEKKVKIFVDAHRASSTWAKRNDAHRASSTWAKRNDAHGASSTWAKRNDAHRAFSTGEEGARTGRPLGDIEILCLDSRNNDIKKLVDKKINKLCDEIVKKNELKGIQNMQIKAMVVGMPNVGKSTFINSYVKKKVNNVANTPGVTKRLQWAKISDKLLLLDTPGVTVPKFSSDRVGTNLAIVGSLNDDIVEKQDLAYEFLDIIKNEYFELLKKRYKLKEVNNESPTLDIMNEIAKNTLCIKKGNEINYEKVSVLILTDFRNGLIGKISLD